MALVKKIKQYFDTLTTSATWGTGASSSLKLKGKKAKVKIILILERVMQMKL